MTIEEISEAYFDNHPLLFPEQASRLDDQTQGLEKIAKHYNCLKGGSPAWTAIDLDVVASSIQEQVPAAVAELVALAKAKSLEDSGELEAASKIMEPYLQVTLDGLRRSKGQSVGGD